MRRLTWWAAAVAVSLLAACQSVPVADRSAPVSAARRDPSSLQGIEAKVAHLGDFTLQSGVVLKDVRIAYETYGKLDAWGRNAILVAHGNTSTPHAAGYYAPGKAMLGVRDNERGWWDAIIGPGKAIDTNRYFVVSSNLLGGSFGSTSPASINPATGKHYGPDFPKLTLNDMVAAQRRLLEALGVKHLAAVAGVSYGGFIALQWAVDYPDMVDRIIPVVTSARGGANPKAISNIVDRLATDPNWNGGRYYEGAAPRKVLTDIRVSTLKSYGLDDELAAQYPNASERDAEIRRRAGPWAERFDANSLVVQRQAMEFRDAERDFGKVKAKVLFVLSSTDKLFPPSIAPPIMAKLKAAGVDAQYVEIDSRKGHQAGTQDAAKYADAVREFLK